MKRSLLLAAGFCHLVATASADWTHYRGPGAHGVSPEKMPASLAGAPQQVWTAKVGTGTSSVTVSGERAFTMGNTGGKDVVWCLNAKTGAVVWKHEYPCELDARMFEGGTAATPTLDGARVFTVSHQGDVFCLDAATGKPVWSKHFQKDFGGQRPRWGFAGSATVEGNLLLLDVGGKGASTVALNKTTGATVWKSGDDGAGYATPVVATIGGKRTVLMFKAEHLVGLDLAGRELWRTAWKTSYDVNAATPMVAGDKVFVSSGYGSGCALFEIGAGGATERWRNKGMKAQMNTPALFQGHVYGIDGQAGPGSPLTCLDLATGATKWLEKTVGGGGVVVADGNLICLTEKGELVIGAASPSGFKALSRTQVLGKRCWVQPTYAAGRIYCRNNEGDLVALELK